MLMYTMIAVRIKHLAPTLVLRVEYRPPIVIHTSVAVDVGSLQIA
jgi:hypothetical protein